MEDIVKNHDIFCIAEYAALDDAAFVHAAYLRLLGRMPDPVGRAHFLADLAAGASRGSVAARLRYAPEGKRHGASVKFGPFYAASWILGKLPVFGAFWQWLLCIIFLRSRLRQAGMRGGSETPRASETGWSLEEMEQLFIHNREALLAALEHRSAPPDVIPPRAAPAEIGDMKRRAQLALTVQEYMSH